MATTKAVIDISINTSDAAAQIRQLQTQINAFNATLNKNSAAHAQASRLFADALVQSVNVSQAFTAEQVRMETAARRLDQTLVKGRGSLGQYFSARFRKDSADAAAVLSLANERAAALQTQFIKLSSSAGGFRDAIAIRPLQALNDSMDVANQKAAIHSAMFRQATTSMINFGKNTQWAGRQLMVGFTVPLTIFGAAAGKTFQEIEQAAVRFKKVYGDAFTTPAEIEENMKAVQGLALEFTKYGIAVKDTIGLAAEAAAAGAQNADLIAATTEATRLATLGQMEQQEALTATIALQNAFKLSSQDLGKEVNFLNMVENQTVVTLQDLAEAIPRVAPVIVGLGGNVRDMAAMLAAMQEGGVSAAQGANALKSGLGSLINPTEKASKVLGEMGINLNAIVQANRGDLMGTVKAFGQALSGLDQFTRQQALEELFGKYQYARLGALFDNIVKDGTQASRVLQIAGLSAEQMAKSAEKELSVISEATSTKYLAAMERFKLAIAPVGEMFMKISTPIINFFSKLFEMFDKLPEGAKTFAAFAALIVGVVVPAGTMFLGLLMNLLGTLAKFGHVIGVAVKGFGKGGFSGAIQAVSQSLRYMGVEEITASTAAQQLGMSTAFANEALLNQVSAAGNATIAIDRLADAYSRLITTQAGIASGRDLVFGAGAAAATTAAGGTPRVRPQRRNNGGKIKFMSGGGSTVPGFGNTDTVPAMLTPGEFVVNKQATQQNLPLLHAINGGMKMPGFNKGGKIPGVKYLNGGGPTLDELLAAYASASSELGGSTARQSTNLGLSLPSSTRTLDMLSPQELSMFNAMSKSALESRGINDALVRLFGLGIVPTSQEINNMLRLGRLSGADAASIFGDPSIWEPMTRTPAGALLPTSGPEFSRAIAAYVSNGLRSRGAVSDDDIYDLVEQAMKRSGGTNFYNELQKDPGALRFGLPELLARHLKETNPKGTIGSIYGPILSSFGTGVRQVDDYLGRPGVFGDFGSLGPLLLGPGKTRTVFGRSERSYENRPEFAFGAYMPGMVRTHALRPIMANSGGLIPGVQYLIGGGPAISANLKRMLDNVRLNKLRSGVTSKYDPSKNPLGYRALRLNPEGQRFKDLIKKRLKRIYSAKPGSGQRARKLSELIPSNIREENVDEVLEAMRLAGIDPSSIDDNTLIQMISTQLSHTVKRRDSNNIIYQADELVTRPGLENKFIESVFNQDIIQEIANNQGEWTRKNSDRIKRLILEQGHPVDQADYQFISEFISKIRNDEKGQTWLNSGSPMAANWFPIFEQLVQKRAIEKRSNPTLEKSVTEAFNLNKGGLIPGLQYFANAGKVLSMRTTPYPARRYSPRTTSGTASSLGSSGQPNSDKKTRFRPIYDVGLIDSDITFGKLETITDVVDAGQYKDFAFGIKSALKFGMTNHVNRKDETVNPKFIKMIEEKYGRSGMHWKMGKMVKAAVSTGDPELIDLVTRLFPSYTAGMRSQNEEERAIATLLGPELLKNSGGLIPGIQYFANAGIVQRLMKSGLQRGQLQRKLESDNQWNDLSEDLKDQVRKWDGVPAGRSSTTSAFPLTKTERMMRVDSGDVDGLLGVMKGGEFDVADEAFIIDYIKEGLDYGRLRNFTSDAQRRYGVGYEAIYKDLLDEANKTRNPKLIDIINRLFAINKNSGGLIQHLISGGPAMSATTRRVIASMSARKSAVQNLQKHGFNSLTDEEKTIIRASGRDVGTMPLFKGTSLLSPDIDDSIKRAILEGTEQSLIGTTTRVPFGSFSEKERIAAPFVFDNNETRRVREIYQELFQSSYMLKDKSGRPVKPKTGKEALEARKLEMTTLPFHLDNPNYTDDDRIRINSERKGYPPSLYHNQTPRLEKLAEEYDQLIAGGAGKGIVYRLNPSATDLPPGQARIKGITTEGQITTITLETGKISATPVTKIGGAPIMPGGTDALRSEEEWFISGMNKGGFISIQQFSNGGDVAAIKAFATKPLFESANKTFVPGVGNKDTVPAALTPGEFVINKKATAENLPLLQAINSGAMVRANKGGLLGIQYLQNGAITLGPQNQMLNLGQVGPTSPLPVNIGAIDGQDPSRTAFGQSPKALGIQMATGMGGMMAGGAIGGMAGGDTGSMIGSMVGSMLPMLLPQSMGGLIGGGGAGVGAGIAALASNPVGWVIGGVAAAAAVASSGLLLWRKNIDENAKETANMTANLGRTSNSLSSMAQMFGVMTPSQRQAQMTLNFTKQEAEISQQLEPYFQSEMGQKFIEDLKNATSEERFKKASDYLSSAIASGMLDKTQASAFAKNLSMALGDPTIGARMQSVISRQRAGSRAYLDLANERSSALMSNELIKQVMQSSGGVRSITSAAAAAGVGGSIQALTDFADAIALAEEEYASGTITFKEYNKVIQDSTKSQKIYSEILEKSISGSMEQGGARQAFIDQMTQQGNAPEQIDAFMHSIDIGNAGFFGLDTAFTTQYVAKQLGDQLNQRNMFQQGIKDLLTNPVIGLGLIPKPQKIEEPTGFLGGIVSSLLGGISDLDQETGDAVDKAREEADKYRLKFDKIVKENNLEGKMMSAVARRDMTLEQATQFGQLLAQGGKEAEYALDVFTKTGDAAVAAFAAYSKMFGISESIINVGIEFQQRGGSIAEFQNFLNSIPPELQTKITTVFDEQDFGRQKRMLQDLKDLSQSMSAESASTIMSTSFYESQLKAGKTRDIRVAAISAQKEGVGQEYGQFIGQILLNDNGKGIDTKEFNKRSKIITESLKKLKSEKIDVRKEAVVTMIQQYEDPDGNPIDTKTANKMFEDILKNIGLDETQFLESGGMVISNVIDIQTQINEADLKLIELAAKLAAETDVQKKAVIAREMQRYATIKDRYVESQKTAVEDTSGVDKASGPKSKGGSGGGTKSILQQLKDQFKQLQDIYNGMAKFINSKTGLFKGIAAGPFGPQFIEFLKSQGKEGIKILNGNLEKFKQVYNEFVKVQRQSVKNAFQNMPSAFRAQANLIAGQRELQNKFAAQGISKTQSEAMLGMIGEGATSEYGRLTAKQKAGKKLSKEKLASMKDFERNLPAVAKQAKGLDIETLITTRGELQSVLDYANNLDIPSEFAEKLTEAGIKMNTLGTSSANTYNEIKQIATLENQIQISDKFKEMNEDITVSENIMRAIPGATNELIDSLKTLNVTSITSDDAIRKAAQGLVQYRLESERLKGRLTNLSEEFSLLSDAASAEVEKINKLEIAPIEKEIDKLNKSISNLEKSKRPEQTAIDRLREEEQAIQKVYDERVKALDEIQKANDRIAAQQKGQMDVASALSRGDIAGAAQAALELQRTMAQQRVEDTKSALQQQNESEREAIAAKIKTHEDNIKNIDQQILALQDSIAAKQDLIEKSKEKQAALEEKIYKYQLLRDAIETRRAAESSVDIGEIDIYKKIMEQQKLTLQGLGLENIPGGAEAFKLLQQPLANEQYLRSGQQQGASAQLMSDVSKSIQDALPLIDEAVKQFIDPKTGLPKELNDVQETISAFAKIFGVSAESLQKFTSIAENYLNTVKINGEKDIRSAVADAINQIKAANQAAADNANTKPKKYFGGIIYKAFGGMIGYKGSREPAPGMMYGGKIKKFAAGSFVPGIGSTDKVPALLTPGEFVVRKPVAQAYRSQLEALNGQIYPNMTNIPQPTYSVPNISQTSISPDIAISTISSNLYQVSPMQYNYNISVNAQSNSSPDDIANAVMYRLRAADSRRVRGGRVG